MALDYLQNVFAQPRATIPGLGVSQVPEGVPLMAPIIAPGARPAPSPQEILAQAQGQGGNPFEGLQQKLQGMTEPEKQRLAAKLEQKYPGGPQSLLPPEQRQQADMPQGKEGEGLSPEAKTRWDRFLDEISSPSKSRFLIDLGLRLMQDRGPYQSDADAFARAVGGAMDSQLQLKEAREQGRLRREQLQVELDLKRAQAGKFRADTELTDSEKKRLEADAKRLLALARKYDLEGAAARLQAAGKAAPKELALAQTLGELYYKNYPDRFKDQREANLKALEFVIRDGKDPMTAMLLDYVKSSAGLQKPSEIAQGMQGVKEAGRRAGIGEVTGTPGVQQEQELQSMEQASQMYIGMEPDELRQEAMKVPAARYRYYVDVMGLTPQQALARIKKQMQLSQGEQQ